MILLHKPNPHGRVGGGWTDLDIVPPPPAAAANMILYSRTPTAPFKGKWHERRLLPLPNLRKAKVKKKEEGGTKKKRKSSHDCPEWLIYLKDMTVPHPLLLV